MTYMRGKNCKQISGKEGGRPCIKQVVSLHFPGLKKESLFTVDTVSYEAYTSELLEVFKNFGPSNELKVLWKLTFEGRRNKIKGELFDSVQDILSNCFLLRQPKFVRMVINF